MTKTTTITAATTTTATTTTAATITTAASVTITILKSFSQFPLSQKINYQQHTPIEQDFCFPFIIILFSTENCSNAI